MFLPGYKLPYGERYKTMTDVSRGMKGDPWPSVPPKCCFNPRLYCSIACVNSGECTYVHPLGQETPPEKPTMTDVKLCKDCRWFMPTDERCGHESAFLKDYVYGKDRYYGAAIQRTSSGEKDCAPEAKFWEPRLQEVA